MAGSRTLTLDDIFAIEHVSDAQISPDGAQVAFVVSRGFSEGAETDPEACIWLASTGAGAPPRRFTFGRHADRHPRWSPDGSRLAFLSDRDAQVSYADRHPRPDQESKFQIYVMPMSGGEARRLTEAKAGVSEFKWNPDGNRIAYLAPDADDDEEQRRKQERDDAIHVDHDYKFTRLWVIDAAGGEPRAITPPEYQVRAFAWYEDGWAVLISLTPLADEFVRPWPLVHLAEERPAETLWEGRHGVHWLAGSRDGRALAWLHAGADAGESVDELWALTAGGQPRRITADYRGGIVWAGWTPDAASLLLTAIDSTRTVLGRVPAAGGEVETLLSQRTLAETLAAQPHVTVSDDGQRMAGLIEDGTQPTEIWAGALGGELRQITHFNQHLAEVALGHAETIRWQAPDGLAIDGVLIYPSGYQAGTRYPLIVHGHGGPTWQWLHRFMANWHDWGQWLAAHGYAVLLPNPRGSFGRGREFSHRNRGAWGVGDLGDILSGVDHLIAAGLADPDRLGIGGWSYGGYITAWAIGQTGRFKAAVVGAGVTNLLSFQASDIPSWLPARQMLEHPYRDQSLYVRLSPISYAAAITTPTLILHGEQDERVRLGQGRELYNALRHLKVPTEMVVYPRETHFIVERHHQRDLLMRVAGWFDRWLMPAPTAP